MSRYQLPSTRFAGSEGHPSAPPRGASFNDRSQQDSGPRYELRDEREPTMRCSDCSTEIPMSLLDQHHCARAEAPPRRPPPDSLRVDIQAAGRQATYEQSLSARSPMYPGHLDPTPPLTPNSRPSSPSGYAHGEELSRSISNNSSVSSTGNGKTPFFEKYKNLVGNGGNVAGIGSGMSRSSPSDNLAAQPYTRGPASPSQAPSSSPTSYPDQIPARSPSAERQQQQQQQRPPGNQNGSFGASASDRSNTPPRSRKVSEHDRDAYAGMSELAYDKEDNRRTITASQSTPGLASYASPDPALQPRRPKQTPPLQIPSPTRPFALPSTSRSNEPRPKMSRSATGGSSTSDLEACMEDLRIMTEEGAEEEEGNRSGHLEQSTPPRNYQRAPSPRSRPAALPYSQSSPTLTSPANASPSSRPTERLDPAPREERCTTCRKAVTPKEMQKGGDGHIFCRPCYAERYLPHCRRCEKVIEGGAVTSSDGKVAGKYHPGCFRCAKCSRSFEGSEFYVHGGKPYCQEDWHRLNGSLCASLRCGKPIEGPCVSLVGEENGGGGRYHPEHFSCSMASCAVPLMEHHWVVGGFPYCENHAQGPAPPPNPTARPRNPGMQQEAASVRARKRQTIITRR